LSRVADILGDSLAVLTDYLIVPSQRLHFGYWITSGLLALWVLWRQQKTLRGWTRVFRRNTWLNPSAKLDYKIIVFNAVFKVGLLGQFLFFGLQLSDWVHANIEGWLGPCVNPLSETTALVSYTLALTLVGDLSVYIVHRLMHRVPLLWAFHRLHHSATHMTPLTQLRLHPIELIINNLRSGLVFGVLAGAFTYWAGNAVPMVTFLGVNAFRFAFYSFGANLRHSHVRMPYWHVLEFLFISPFQHQIHHSVQPEHHDRNFGSMFAIWDWAFGTLVMSRSVKKLKFGLTDAPRTTHKLSVALLAPFQRSNVSD